VVDALDRPLDKAATASEAGPLDIPAKSNTSPAEFRTMVQKAKDYILAGDIFQVVLSQRFAAPFTCRRWRSTRAAPGQSGAVSVFPRLRRLRHRRIEPRGAGAAARRHGDDPPLAGTRPRGERPMRTRRWRNSSWPIPKERAEHLMLLDLGRNDVGRVAKIGTVKVTDQFFIERYSHVMHIVSNVEGDARREARCARRAGRGISRRHGVGRAEGAAMQIIDELEKEKRGTLRRLRRLFLRRRRNGQLHRAAAPR
jgi:anthranilate synthase component 1